MTKNRVKTFVENFLCLKPVKFYSEEINKQPDKLLIKIN